MLGNKRKFLVWDVFESPVSDSFKYVGVCWFKLFILLSFVMITRVQFELREFQLESCFFIVGISSSINENMNIIFFVETIDNPLCWKPIE